MSIGKHALPKHARLLFVRGVLPLLLTGSERLAGREKIPPAVSRRDKAEHSAAELRWEEKEHVVICARA
jgi:hypothetical protein